MTEATHYIQVICLYNPDTRYLHRVIDWNHLMNDFENLDEWANSEFYSNYIDSTINNPDTIHLHGESIIHTYVMET